jgi:hypothetical protein
MFNIDQFHEAYPRLPVHFETSVKEKVRSLIRDYMKKAFDLASRWEPLWSAQSVPSSL